MEMKKGCVQGRVKEEWTPIFRWVGPSPAVERSTLASSYANAFLGCDAIAPSFPEILVFVSAIRRASFSWAT